ncbi:MAG: 3-hydroxyacyl-CoA dehydrogenase NAD-binding domain-containing protein [Burkholderiales bacterium]
MSLVRLEQDGDVAVIVIDNPPVNALSPGVGEGIVAALDRALADPAVIAIVLMGAGRSFIAGADIRTFGKGVVRPPIGERPSDKLDMATKPIVAAIHGYALGGGLEYALACHYRIATATAKVGLPEVLIGVIPGGGGTQRLPRLIGPRAALDLIVSGRHVPAPEAHAMGLLDALVPQGEDLRTAAVAFARRVSGVRPLPRVANATARMDEARADPQVFDDKRKAIAREARNRVAPFRCIDLVEAAVLRPIDEGMRYERQVFEALENAPEARGLRYAFFAEREAAKLPDVPQPPVVAPVSEVAVVGAGTMGSGIAMACADAGLRVRLLDASPELGTRAMGRIAALYEASVARGRLDRAEADRRIALIAPVDDYAALANANVAVEAVYEDLAVKEAVFRSLDRVMPPGSLLLTNTSTIDVDAIAAATRRPQDVAGAHFFSPAHVMKLLEVIRGARTSDATLAGTVAFGKRLSKVNVVVRNREGFLTSRSRTPFTNEMVLLLEEGALPEDVDRVMVEFGYPMGPFAVSDLAGLDIAYAVRRRKAELDPAFRSLPIADAMVERGRLGQKAGKGWYRYGEDRRTPMPDPEVAALIADFARVRNAARPDDEQILRRLLFAGVNEICRIVDEGLVYRASDVDVAWVHGFGFPRYRGGPLFWADGIGAREVHAELERWQDVHGERYAPAPLLAQVARSGGLLREMRPGTMQQ